MYTAPAILASLDSREILGEALGLVCTSHCPA